MIAALAAVALVVGVVLNVGAVLSLAHWQSARVAARAAAATWVANGANPDTEPAPAPGVTSPPFLIGAALVVLSALLTFLFAWHLGTV